MRLACVPSSLTATAASPSSTGARAMRWRHRRTSAPRRSCTARWTCGSGWRRRRRRSRSWHESRRADRRPAPLSGGVGTYLGGRLLGAIPMLFLMSLVVFAIVYLIPGDPIDAMLGQDAEHSAREALRHELGLDQPLWRQYVSWLARVAQGDLGRSIRAQQPVRDLIQEKLPATLLLTTTAAVVALLGVSIPSFWSGIMLIMIFALTLGWLPAIGYASLTTDPVAALRYLVL